MHFKTSKLTAKFSFRRIIPRSLGPVHWAPCLAYGSAKEQSQSEKVPGTLIMHFETSKLTAKFSICRIMYV